MLYGVTNMPYERFADKDVDLSALGFGDNLTIDYDKTCGKLRISVFDRFNYQDGIEIDLVHAFACSDG